MEEKTKIDVYSDKFKTINVIDFEKLKKEALRLKEISDKYKQPKILNILDIAIWGIAILITYLTTKVLYDPNFPFALLIGIFVGMLVLAIYFIGFKLLIYHSKRKKHFPIGTPDDITVDFKSKLTPQEIEKFIYANYVLKLSHDLPSHINYKILGPIKLEEIYKLKKGSYNQFFKAKEQSIKFAFNAYHMKANVITNYNVSKNYITNVHTTGIRNKNIETQQDVETVITGTAVQVISENKDSNTTKSNEQL